jgi:hypothetical protein
MISAAAYILRVPENRREILLRDQGGRGFYGDEEPPAGEPVPRFDHSRRAPLVVLACFEDDAITHIADGRKGNSAGRGLVVLNMRAIEPLERPVLFTELRGLVPVRIRTHLNRILFSGGKLPPKSLGAVIDAMLSLQPDLAPRLARFSERRSAMISRLTPAARINLSFQKETLATALSIAGLETEQLLAWSPETPAPRSFLEGLPQAYVREDAAIISDFAALPGFDAIGSLPFAAKVFEKTSFPPVRLTVVMANRLPLEEQTGADLIYFNETYRSFVLVQYKSMNKGARGPEFRWQENDQLADEIKRMDTVLEALGKLPQDQSPASFRLHTNPFFLKLCARTLFNPDDKGLFSGMYLPLDLWRCLSSDPATEGQRGGRVISYDNVGRKLTNTEFIALVANAWVGTTVPQSSLLEKVIREVIGTGKTVTFAIKHRMQSHEGDPKDIDSYDADDEAIDSSPLL